MSLQEQMKAELGLQDSDFGNVYNPDDFTCWKDQPESEEIA